MISKGIILMVLGAIIAVIAYKILENIKLNTTTNELGVSKKPVLKDYFGKFLGIIGVLVFYLGVLLLILRYAIS
jgi:hypothetical protein